MLATPNVKHAEVNPAASARPTASRAFCKNFACNIVDAMSNGQRSKSRKTNRQLLPVIFNIFIISRSIQMPFRQP